ncbi:unnamed protein product [Sphagnum balticum]
MLVLDNNGLRGVWACYVHILVLHPMYTQMFTSALLWGSGDVVAQVANGFGQMLNGGKMDWKRVGTASLFGAIFVGPVGNFWYQFLEYVCAKRLKFEPNSICFMGTKLLADTFLYGPMHLLVFFLYMGLVAGNTLVQMKQDIKDDYFPTLLTEGIVWMCIQLVNFRFVPVQHQLLFVNGFSLLDSAFLSWVKYYSGTTSSS